MVFNFFKKDKDEDNNDNLGKRIDEAIRKVQNDKRDAEREIKKLDGWARDAIIDVYADFFENAHLSFYRDKHKADALEKYPQIKEQHSSKISAEMVEKCDKIIGGYLNQIELLKSKIKLFEKLHNEYSATKKKLQTAKSQGSKIDRLKEHSERLKKLDDSGNVLSGAMTDSYELEDIKNEVEHKEAYFNELEKLNHQYSLDDSNYDNAQAYKEELDKMINNMDKK